jgi:hypothetical protein
VKLSFVRYSHELVVSVFVITGFYCTQFRLMLDGNIKYWVERKVFAFSKRWRKQTKNFFYKTGIEKLVTRWETVIASNRNYIID